MLKQKNKFQILVFIWNDMDFSVFRETKTYLKLQ